MKQVRTDGKYSTERDIRRTLVSTALRDAEAAQAKHDADGLAKQKALEERTAAAIERTAAAEASATEVRLALVAAQAQVKAANQLRVAAQAEAAKAAVTNETAVWECKSDQGWHPFDGGTSAAIEAAYMADRSAVVSFKRSGVTYDCDLGAMMQRRTDGQYSTSRQVQRRVIGHSAAASVKAGQKVVLKHGDGTESERQHFAEAASQFYHMLGDAGQWRAIDRVEYYGFENSKMQADYDAKRGELRSAGHGDEMQIFHGTDPKNVKSIMVGGFRIGGQDGHAVANGTAHGQGVYTAVTPKDPLNSYGMGKVVIICKALAGKTGKDSDSWTPSSDWRVFKTAAQVMPCYAVYF